MNKTLARTTQGGLAIIILSTLSTGIIEANKKWEHVYCKYWVIVNNFKLVAKPHPIRLS